MKVVVLWENTYEKAIAANLVAVLYKIGNMLIYGKVNKDGVMLEDWKNKPRVNLQCVAAASPEQFYTKPSSGYSPSSLSFEVDYVDGVGYVGPAQPNSGTLSITRELMRDLVRMFPEGANKGEPAQLTPKKRKPVVPKPNTTPTGVTVRKLDLWEEDEHADTPDQ